MLESKSNKSNHDIEHNEIVIKVEGPAGQFTLIKIQHFREKAYLFRVLFNHSDVLIQDIDKNTSYNDISSSIDLAK